MAPYVLYHHRQRSKRPTWDRVGAYDTLEAAQDAARAHATTPLKQPQAWIVERRGNEWRLVADGEAYKVERLAEPGADQAP